MPDIRSKDTAAAQALTARLRRDCLGRLVKQRWPAASAASPATTERLHRQLRRLIG